MANWTSTPPTEPGWYFWRLPPHDKIVFKVWNFMGGLVASTRPIPTAVEDVGGEWGPKIEEPQ